MAKFTIPKKIIDAYWHTFIRQLKEGKLQIREVQDVHGHVISRVVTRTLECDPRFWEKLIPPPLFAESALTTIMANLFAELDAMPAPSETKTMIETFLRAFGAKYEEELSKRGLPVQLSLFGEYEENHDH
jgi:hypothetical protein